VEEVIVYIYSIGGVKYYKLVPSIYKEVLGRFLDAATKFLNLINKPLDFVT
jgi:hypothetical protein